MAFLFSMRNWHTAAAPSLLVVYAQRGNPTIFFSGFSHQTSPFLGGLVSMRGTWTTALRADSSSHMIEITGAKGSGHLSVHLFYGEGSLAVSGPASCPVGCHVRPRCSCFKSPSGGDPAAPISISMLFLLQPI